MTDATEKRNCCDEGGLVTGFLLIGVGSLLLADKLDLLEIRDIWRYWPLILIAVGLAQLVGRISGGR